MVAIKNYGDFVDVILLYIYVYVNVNVNIYVYMYELQVKTLKIIRNLQENVLLSAAENVCV